MYHAASLSTLILNYARVSCMLSGAGRDGNIRLGSALHAAILKFSNTLFQFRPPPASADRDVLVVWNSVIAMYSGCGALADATAIFQRMLQRDTISWNSVISACLREGKLQQGFLLFHELRCSDSCRIDRATLTTVLSTCADAELVNLTEMLHSLIVRSGHMEEVPVGNALMTAYFRCGCPDNARKVFDEMLDRNVITWTAAISGLIQSQQFREGLLLFSQMQRSDVPTNSITYTSVLTACAGARGLHEAQQVHALVLKSGNERDLCTENALMDVYSKCGMVKDACRIFQSSESPDNISCTVILTGLSQNESEEAFRFFVELLHAGVHIDEDMVSAVLGAFGVCTPIGLGMQIHAFAVKKCFTSNVFVYNGMINMYSKCGDLGSSIKVFDRMTTKNPVTWNSMIAAFARHGHVPKAIRLYEDMVSQGFSPTDVTFLSLLHACSHAGAVEQGMQLLRSMISSFHLAPRAEHYACAIDMLGRAGRLEEAKALVEDLPIEPNPLVWQSLLGASSICGDLETAKYAAQRLLQASPDSPAAYVMLGNLYCSGGAWKERAGVMKTMKEMRVKKETGMSWIEVAGSVNSFVAGDKVHPDASRMYNVLWGLLVLSAEEDSSLDMEMDESFDAMM